MNSKPLVSVIVPFYNEEKYIEKCLDSVKRQTYPHIELIVVNDGSTDKSAKLAKRYADVFIHQKHNGPGVARNKAAKEAKGKILIFIDADMYLDDKYIENLVKPIIVGVFESSFTRDEYVANPQNIWTKCYFIDNNLKGAKKNIDSSKQKNYYRAITKNLFVKIGGYNIKFGYTDDNKNNSRFKINSALAKGAVCYHYNPDSLKEVYLSSRWIGRSPEYKKNLKNILRYSFVNSLLISLKKISKGAPLNFLTYKLVFDFGILSGILSKNLKNYYAK